MVNISSNNPQSQYRIAGKKIDGFTVNVVSYDSAGVGNHQAILDNLQLKGTLKRSGMGEVELFNTTLKNLVLLSHLTDSPFYFVASDVFIALDGTDNYALKPLRFDFGGAINLQGSDEFILEWQLASNFFAGSSSTTASYILLDECETNETEYFVPKTHVTVIEAGQTNPTYALGDNITKVVFRQDDKNDTYTASAVINNMQLTSKNGLQKNDSYIEILTKNYSYYSLIAEAQERVQNFLLYAGSDELDGVQLQFNLNGTNVASSKNFILHRSFITSDLVMTRAAITEAKREQAAEKKGSYNSAVAATLKF